jgi:TonB family protein
MHSRAAILLIACAATLFAQNTEKTTIQALVDNIDASIAAAQASGDTALLEKQADELTALYQYASAGKLLDAALAIREKVSGPQSAPYGMLLLKLGALESHHNTKLAVAFYEKATHLLPGVREAATAYLYLGIHAIGDRKWNAAIAGFQQAQHLDPSLTGKILMWTALLHERRGENQDTETAYHDALAALTPGTPDEADAQTLYARFLRQQGREDEAKAADARANAGHKSAITLPKPMPSGTYRVGGGVTQPSVTYKVDPSYSEEARVAKIIGAVLLVVVIETDGTAGRIRIDKPVGFGLDDCAIASLAQWHFNPGMKNGSPVAVYATIEVNFRLI